MKTSNSVPVLILGGQENTISLLRSFGKRNIKVYISVRHNSLAIKSRHCHKVFTIPDGKTDGEAWQALLLFDERPELRGCVIFPGSDEAVDFLASNRRRLKKRYRIDCFRSGIHLAMLDKFKTLALAQKAECPTPAFFKIDIEDDVEKIIPGILFPIMVKPIHSHIFTKYYPSRKYFIAQNESELRHIVGELLGKKIEIIITEMIPGADDQQSAYFTYITESGEVLFEYTHQIIRRYPRNSGLACLTISRDLPETAEMGRRFFNGIGYQGMGHIEFKRDPRDGKLKIIECNPRMSAAQAVVTKSGLDMAFYIYDYLVNGKVTQTSKYRTGVRRWWVMLDILSFLELRRIGEITFMQWIKTVNGPPLVFPYFSLNDPMPFVCKFYGDISRFFKKKVKSLWLVRKGFPIQS